MSLQNTRPLWAVLMAVIAGVVLLPGSTPAQQRATFPSPDETAQLLHREPITPATWPTWRGRLLAWTGDRGHGTDAAFDSAREFLKGQATAEGELAPALARDALAWDLLGSAYLADVKKGADPETGTVKAERALRRSLQLDPNFAWAHWNLAVALLWQEEARQMLGQPPQLDRVRLAEARKTLNRARQLDPTLPQLTPLEAQLALRQENYTEAERLFLQALREEPDKVGLAHYAADAILRNRQRPGSRAQPIQDLLDKFPDNGFLICQHAMALLQDGDARGAARELQRARSLGTDPVTVLHPQNIQDIEAASAPTISEYVLWIAGGFVAFYAAVMLLMAGAGWVLAGWTRGDRALALLGMPSDELVAEGQVLRTRHESLLARLYALSLFLSLILFYLAIPFLIAGLLAGTGLLLYLIFAMGRIPVRLVILILILGIGGAWAIFKSLFARPASGAFGLAKTAEQCPRLYQLLTDVAHRVDTGPVDEVYLAPGASIGVHQEGRGPFGMFGVKRRVLTLGLSTLHFLTVGELQSILAHEYAHFSHRDTFYSRFIYQVTLSISEALNGMGRTAGGYSYFNPIFWFLVLYYKAFNLLSAGYSRSREFLADRMAASLYGSDVFSTALTKVSTDGVLFEMTVYDNISRLLNEGKVLINLYTAFLSYREEELGKEQREVLYNRLLDEKPSLFASHPTFGERIAAVEALPRATVSDKSSALSLFNNVEELEKELTEFLTGYVNHVRQLQAQAAQ